MCLLCGETKYLCGGWLNMNVAWSSTEVLVLDGASITELG